MNPNQPDGNIMTFTSPDRELGRLYHEGGKLQFSGNASEAAKVFFDYVIKENNSFLTLVEEQNNQLHGELLAVEHDRDHWKNNHDHQVKCARVIKCRHDIPVERALLHDALLAAVPEGTQGTSEAMDVVTRLPTLEHVLEVYNAAKKLVKCKGRYHAELNYRALAETFGVSLPVTQPVTPEQTAAMQELTDISQDMGLYESTGRVVSEDTWNKLQQMIAEPAAPSEALRELMTREPKCKREC